MDCDFVKVLLIHTESACPMFLVHQHNWTSARRRAWTNVPFWSNSWIWHFIYSFSRSEHLYTGPFGKGALGIKSIECLTWKCRCTHVGGVNMSLYSSMTFTTFFCCVVGLCAVVMDVATIFFSLWERTMKRTSFPVCVMTFLHFLVEIKEVEGFGPTYGIL